MSDRLTAARDYVAKKPTDRFGLYTLGMELRKLQSWPECFAAFDTLLEVHPTYGPGYYHYAMARRESGDRPGCIDVLKRGLVVTETNGDQKTNAEITDVLDELGAL